MISMISYQYDTEDIIVVGIILFHTFDIIVCTMISLFMVSKWKYDVICKNPDSIVQKKMLSSIIMYDIIS